MAVPEASPRPSLVRTDLRVLDLLLAPTGAHVSAPDFDPFFVNSGGYGYCWFGEDATVAKHLLAVDDSVDLGVADRLGEKAAFYCAGQLDDGTWPHRVWASDGDLAPGWANAHVENDDTSGEYQAHQTAQVTAFLARFLRTRGDDVGDDLGGEIRETLADAVDALDDSLDQNDLPDLCQNVWEDAMGQFAHTAACYLEAYAAVARAPVGPAVEAAATASAHRVYEGLDELWDEDAGTFARRLDGNGIPDRRLDASTFALVDAFRTYASLEGETLSETDLDRLTGHVGALLNGLYRNPRGNPVGGLVRFEGDRWRTMDQASEKIWPLATAMGAAAAATLGELLEGYGRNGEAFLKRGSDLYNLLREDGPLTSDVGYLPAQVFDDGTLDGATPLGTAHALRLRATTVLGEQNALPTAPAPTGPEERLRWTTGEKYGVSTVADHGSPDPSRVWFTLTEGALTEARFPRVDLMNLRTLDFLVRCRDEQYVVRTHKENRRRSGTDTVDRRVEPAADDALLFRHVITEQSDGHGHEWSLTVEYAADPDHDAVVADVTFEARDGKRYDVFAVADTALSTTGETERGLRLSGSTGHHLVARDAEAYTQSATPPLLVDENGEGYSVALALAAERRFDWATVGVAGDQHLQTLFSEEDLPAERDSVESDHVVLVGRIGSGEATDTRIALGFAGKADTAAALGEAEGALAAGYESIRDGYRDSWQSFLADKPLPEAVAHDPDLAAQYRSALMTLLAVEDKTFEGASVASPSVPWGEVVTASKAQGVGYNFVWSRDLYQVFTVFDAVDGIDRAIDHLEFVYDHQQQPDGFVPQNTYVNGETRWVGEQMDNISFPQVMAYHLWERGLSFDDVGYDFENLRRSADYVVQNGPATSQERWEEEAGYSPSTIAAEIAGLVCAGKVAMDTGHDADALSWFALADQWTNVVESWTATETGTEKHGHTPYYVRVTRDGEPESGVKRTLANGGPTLDERDIIDGGFLELVRLGIKPWDDPVVRNSVAEVDKTIRVDLDGKPAFYRYNGDGYGERERGDQGGPWSVEHNGKGRLWPLLTGERGEYELLTEGEAASDDPGSPLRDGRLRQLRADARRTGLGPPVHHRLRLGARRGDRRGDAAGLGDGPVRPPGPRDRRRQARRDAGVRPRAVPRTGGPRARPGAGAQRRHPLPGRPNRLQRQDHGRARGDKDAGGLDARRTRGRRVRGGPRDGVRREHLHRRRRVGDRPGASGDDRLALYALRGPSEHHGRLGQPLAVLDGDVQQGKERRVVDAVDERRDDDVVRELVGQAEDERGTDQHGEDDEVPGGGPAAEREPVEAGEDDAGEDDRHLPPEHLLESSLDHASEEQFLAGPDEEDRGRDEQQQYLGVLHPDLRGGVLAGLDVQRRGDEATEHSGTDGGDVPDADDEDLADRRHRCRQRERGGAAGQTQHGPHPRRESRAILAIRQRDAGCADTLDEYQAEDNEPDRRHLDADAGREDEPGEEGQNEPQEEAAAAEADGRDECDGRPDDGALSGDSFHTLLYCRYDEKCSFLR